MSLPTRPLISIIVPSFNQGRFIRATLDSILTQDYRPIEILVLDGGSKDETVSVLESFAAVPELKWWSEPDNGVTDAVNKGMQRASGQIVAIQSSDDLYLPGAISAAVKFLTSHQEVMLTYGDVEYIDEHSVKTGSNVPRAFDLKHYLGRFTYIPQPSAFFRAEVITAIGGWRSEVSYAADADFWLRIAMQYKVAKIDRLMAQYRFHAEQRDKQKTRIARDWEKTIRDILSTFPLDRASRQFARMGIYLAHYHYTQETDWVRRTRYLYQAAAANPRAVMTNYFPKRELLIGREPIWKFLSRVKRGLGFQPRTSAKT